GSQGRIQPPEAAVALLVVPLRVDSAARPDTARDRVVGVREHARADADEEGGAERGALLGGGRLERQLERRGEDAEPQLAACAASQDASAFGIGAELAQELERVAQPVGDALQHRAPQRAAVVAYRDAREGAARVRVRMGRALAGEIRREGEPLDS